jgi:hypothetical protein
VLVALVYLCLLLVVENDVQNSSLVRIILIAVHILLIPITLAAQAYEQLLKDGLMSPYMLNLLNKSSNSTYRCRKLVIIKTDNFD